MWINGQKLTKRRELNDLFEDVIAVLVLGSSANDKNVARILENCSIAKFIGKPVELQKFVQQRYIYVSRITGGATANTLGQLAQKYVHKYVEDHLEMPDVKISSNTRIPGIHHGEDKLDTSFDLVVQRGNSYVAIEISFQATTNSTIERKRDQAGPRYEVIHQADYRIAYVIDGVGNFFRKPAIQRICEYSDCTVAFSDTELEHLCQFLRKELVRKSG